MEREKAIREEEEEEEKEEEEEEEEEKEEEKEEEGDGERNSGIRRGRLTGEEDGNRLILQCRVNRLG